MKVVSVAGLLAIAAFFLFAYGVVGLVRQLGEGAAGYVREKRPHLTVLRVDGTILTAQTLLESLERIERNPACRGVLVRIDSPGGAVGASQEILAGLERIKAKDIPVVVSHGNLAASGGYYVSLAGDRIFSNPGTLTGSIGVIFQFPVAEELLGKVGVQMHTVKSGRLKDVGSIARAPSKSEVAYLQSVVDTIYGRFVSDILSRRRVERDELMRVADGRVLTGEQALASGLVDSLGGFDVALDFLARESGLGDKPVLVREPPPRAWWESLMESALPWGGAGEAVRARSLPGAYFLWP